ncbi:MAG: O-antigen ligase family protein [Cyanobacteria bacterium J06621_8]
MIDTIQRDKNNLIVYYQGFIAVAAVLVFFTKIDQYLQGRGIGMPLLWMIAFTLASIPLFVNAINNLQWIPKPVLVWSALYLAISLASIVFLTQLPELQLLEDIVRSIMFLLLMLVIFSQHPLALKWAKLTILLVTIANILMYVYEFFNPLAFYIEQHAAGRASGFYHNSNMAGNTVILGMILSIDLVKPKYRSFYALFSFLGVVATFSRSAIIGCFIVTLLFMVIKVIPRYQVPLFFLSGFMIISILATQSNSFLYLKNDDGVNLFTEDSLARVEFLYDPLSQADSSKDSRLKHADKAWEKFARHPFLGNGLGSGQNSRMIGSLGTAQRSHNIYLDLMVEYGFLGALLYPGLVFASVWKVQGELKKQAIVLVVFFLIWGFFSHTVLSATNVLLSYAFMANLAQQNRSSSL